MFTCPGLPAPWCALRLQVSRLAFDLGVADGGATFMRIDSHALDLQDLRLAYRQGGGGAAALREATSPEH